MVYSHINRVYFKDNSEGRLEIIRSRSRTIGSSFNLPRTPVQCDVDRFRAQFFSSKSAKQKVVSPSPRTVARTKNRGV